MSLEIDVEKISEVLLADGWHKVSPVGDGRSSFGLDVYEFHNVLSQEKADSQENAGRRAKEGKDGKEGNESRQAGQQRQDQAGARSGARWTESDGSRVFCPVTSILAVKYAGQNKSE